MKKYKFGPYNKKFPLLFRREKLKLINILPKGIQIEHIGSTAVPGLRGKGLIDIIIGVPKNKLSRIKSYLEKAGYEFRPNAGDKNRLFFRKDYSFRGKIRRIHIHLTQYLSKDWLETIAVRDYLRNNKREAKRYEKIKRKAIKIAKGDGAKYRKSKKNYLRRLTEKALKHILLKKINLAVYPKSGYNSYILRALNCYLTIS